MLLHCLADDPSPRKESVFTSNMESMLEYGIYVHDSRPHFCDITAYKLHLLVFLPRSYRNLAYFVPIIYAYRGNVHSVRRGRNIFVETNVSVNGAVGSRLNNSKRRMHKHVMCVGEFNAYSVIERSCWLVNPPQRNAACDALPYKATSAAGERRITTSENKSDAADAR